LDEAERPRSVVSDNDGERERESERANAVFFDVEKENPWKE
jgi:hypothetical protein